jgi:exopolyphosphatase/guanosine-5'-triphosphate,3'-diphosphate pyrophosphatase
LSVRLAAIDLGTVTARLLIADVDDAKSEGVTKGASTNRGESAVGGGEHGVYRGRIRELERRMKITHLGDELYATGGIGDAAIAREIAACEEFKAAIKAIEGRDGHPVEVTLAVATSAMRDAHNSDEVLDALLNAGVEVEIIAGRREAELSFRGALSGFAGDSALKERVILSVDVGGGSTEVILGMLEDGGRSRVFSECSFDIGSRRVTDRFFKSDPPTPEELSTARAWIHAEMAPYFARLTVRPQILIAVAGTATTAVTVRDAMVDYDPWKIHGSRVTRGELNKVLNELAKLELDKRRACVGLEPERASVIVGGLLVLQAIRELVGLEVFVVSETDILQGILLDAADSPKRAPGLCASAKTGRDSL